MIIVRAIAILFFLQIIVNFNSVALMSRLSQFLIDPISINFYLVIWVCVCVKYFQLSIIPPKTFKMSRYILFSLLSLHFSSF